MRELARAIADVAPTDLPVLLVGERGTGKELLAREIHRHRRPPNGVFLKFLCSILSSPSLRGNLEEIAGDDARRSGQAGTVFLDEISELSAPSQSALASLLAESDGKPASHPLRAHLICSTSRNLEEEIQKRRFREDLFYRINGVCLRVPPLRQRREDIPILVDFFLKKHAEALGRPLPDLTSGTMQSLVNHSWPGNIRELEAVAKLLVSSDEGTALAHLNSDAAEFSRGKAVSGTLSLKEAARNASRQVERELILKTLSRTRWNRKRAAQELGISYKALLYKLKQITFEDSVDA
jgi:DNA-binding NtrC family response regulator